MVWHPYFTFTDGVAPPPPPPVGPTIAPSGGYPSEYHPYLRRPRYRRIEKVYEDLALATQQIVDSVANRQVQVLETDQQKIFEELERELELKGIEWESRYLEALNAKREFLIDQEIGRLLRKKLKDEEELVVILTLMAASLI